MRIRNPHIEELTDRERHSLKRVTDDLRRADNALALAQGRLERIDNRTDGVEDLEEAVRTMRSIISVRVVFEVRRVVQNELWRAERERADA